MRDTLVTLVVLLAFASLLTAHVAIAWGLIARAGVGRAAAALVVPPLAPYWGYQTGMRTRAGVWIGAVIVYAVTLWLAAS